MKMKGCFKMDIPYKVILKRAPYAKDKMWRHDSEFSALQRASALCKLHSCKFQMTDEVTYVVDARGYYNG